MIRTRLNTTGITGYRAGALASALAGALIIPLASVSAQNMAPSGYTSQYDAWHEAHHTLMQAATNENRREDAARDQYRHPVETLEFFDVRPDMKVGEYAPGGGWYSRLLGNYLGDKGQLVGLYFNPGSGPFDDKAQAGIRAGAAGFSQKLASQTGKPAERFSAFTLDRIPESEAGTFDRILVIRMLHNMTRWSIADSEIKAMRSLLKDGGMMGIVQHRARADAPYSTSDGSKGYLRQDDVIAFMKSNGFDLIGMSEINANPQDSADHPKGVWEMPPSFSTKDPKLENIGESDRMTLLFRKRP
ncbi:MAG: class I SAM-dependent methyltransferase [Sphingomonadaceae bacterium]